jgi:hypothetical protein
MKVADLGWKFLRVVVNYIRRAKYFMIETEEDKPREESAESEEEIDEELLKERDNEFDLMIEEDTPAIRRSTVHPTFEK